MERWAQRGRELSESTKTMTKPDPIKTEGHTITQFWGKSKYKNAVWVTNEAEEGMEVDGDLIPDGRTEEWMEKFWAEHF